MPFERYLSDDQVVNHNGDHNYYYQDYKDGYDDADCHYAHRQHSHLPEPIHHDHHHPHAVHFQIPQFMLSGPPMLAPGGGAEVLPAGLLGSVPDPFTSSWIANNGFAPFHSSLISKQISSGVTPPDRANTHYHTFDSNWYQRLPLTFPPRFTASVGPRQQPLPEPPPSLDATANYIHDLTPPPCSGTSNPAPYAPSNVLASDPFPSLLVTAPSALGLPVYSASGFDVLSVLSRVVSRPNPTIQLGPVDFSCSFVIVDVRRYDSPIVYASPTFCHLTGYNEQEVLGRNCRFLQSPTGNVAKSEPRRFVSPEAVSYMRKLLSSSKECQTTLINYRKGGQAFINLITVIPLRGGVHNTPEEADEVAYHIGFQVDLTEQPTRILDKLRDGSYYSVNNNSWGAGNVSNIGGLSGMSRGPGQLAQAQNMTSIGFRGGRHGQMMSIAVSKELRNLIADTAFTDSVPISTGTNMSGPTGASSASADQCSNATMPLTTFVTPPSSSTSVNRMSASGNTMAGSIPISLSPSLSLLLLEFLPDFLLVLSLKGAFLYVAPSVRLVLGYEPQELVGRGISDICHPADLVPLMRELKEGSVNGLGISGTGDVGLSTGVASNLPPKSVDLLFRALPKASAFSLHRETQNTSAEQGDSHSSRPSSGSASQVPPSGAGSSNDPSGRTAPLYVWLECRGRLHVEPGKGRKAIILSGRARWMPVVRWGNVDKAGDVGSVRCRGDSAHIAPHITADSRLCEISSVDPAGASTDPLEFWALLSSQGTFLVASASVRDILGWGTSEVIGRNICSMVRDNRGGMRERLEAELARLDTLEVKGITDAPPSVVTTALVHREFHTVSVRLALYRTPRPDKCATPSTSSIGITSTPFIHPLNNPLCPIVCQATVLSNTEYQSNKNTDDSFGPTPDRSSSQVQLHTDIEDDTEESCPLAHSPGATLFEELETVRGSSWQYELQQLKFANQRLHEELHALEGACANRGTGTRASSSTTGPIAVVPASQSCSSSASTTSTSIPSQPQFPQTQLHHVPLMHSTLTMSLPSLRPSNSLHEKDPPTSDWSSLAGANGQGPNPLKRSWRSEDGPGAT